MDFLGSLGLIGRRSDGEALRIWRRSLQCRRTPDPKIRELLGLIFGAGFGGFGQGAPKDGIILERAHGLYDVDDITLQ